MSEKTKIQIKILFPDDRILAEGKDVVVDSLLRSIKHDKEAQFAGFSDFKKLQVLISSWIDPKYLPEFGRVHDFPTEQVKDTIMLAIHECLEKLPSTSISVFVFPKIHKFSAYEDKMGRVSGYTPCASIIHVYMSNSGYSLDALADTVTHEFCHAVFFEKGGQSKTIKQTTVFEGLATCFQESVRGKTPFYAQTLSTDESAQLLSKIDALLDTKVTWEPGSKYRELFIGEGNYPKWAGYSISYHIVKSYIEEYPKKTWTDLLATHPNEIFSASPFTNVLQKKRRDL